MTQAYNLAILANAVDTSGKLNVGTNATGTLPVANGGTGTSTPSLVAGTGITITGSFPNQTVAASSSGGGNYQYSIATRAAATNSSGTPLVWNSTGNLTFTAPTGVTRVKITCVAGGGSGGGGSFAGQGSNGGFGGVAVGVFTVTPGTAYAVTVGVGGAPNGQTGGTSSFGALVSATGGAAGGGPGNLNGATGTGTGGNIRNSTSSWTADSAWMLSVYGSLGGSDYYTPNAQNGGGSAQVWTISSKFTAGGFGDGGGDQNNGSTTAGGGVSGAVLIEYVGP